MLLLGLVPALPVPSRGWLLDRVPKLVGKMHSMLMRIQLSLRS
jgi:hypothetical protein